MIKTIYLAGGCFWGVQHYFDQFDGILKTIVGYANGKTQNPEYKDVKAGLTGHAETLEIQYDDKMISLSKILDLYFDIIDPVSVNQQGEDIGISYRTGIYYVEKADLETIQSKYNEIQKKYDSPLAVEVEPMKNFFNAEEYHQKYLDKIQVLIVIFLHQNLRRDFNWPLLLLCFPQHILLSMRFVDCIHLFVHPNLKLLQQILNL